MKLYWLIPKSLSSSFCHYAALLLVHVWLWIFFFHISASMLPWQSNLPRTFKINSAGSWNVSYIIKKTDFKFVLTGASSWPTISYRLVGQSQTARQTKWICGELHKLIHSASLVSKFYYLCYYHVITELLILNWSGAIKTQSPTRNDSWCL